ncbi:MAG: protein-methionine-sulfoxide reductase catalytic subunit MsrP [Gemmatimonadota bacterium]
MANLILPPGWSLPDRAATPTSIYWDRRSFVKTLGLGALALGSGACTSPGRSSGDDSGVGSASAPPSGPLDTIPETPTRDLYPGPRSPHYALDRPVTDRILAATHNNFYEFTTDKAAVWTQTGPFQARPWTVEIAGDVENPGIVDVADLEREFGLEERLYRFRCVEAWAMAVPWTGFPLARLIQKAQPLSSARYVLFTTFLRPAEAIGQRTQSWYTWPYWEALRLDEAMNELAFVATGIYGEPLPKQHGAPLRLVLPWKYGFKSAKSIVRMEFVRERPSTFWSDFAPSEYGFYSNVNPQVPHPRWSQASEEVLGESERRPTLPFNGYGEWVADLYDDAIMRGIT